MASPAQNIQGPFFIGLTVNILLHGVLTTQVYLYFTKYKTDTLWLKTFIVVLYIADSFNCIISIYYIYNALVTHFGDDASLLTANWAGTRSSHVPQLNYNDLHDYRCRLDVQHFFAWRVYVLSKNILVVLAIILCSLVNFAGSLGATVSVALNPSFTLLPGLTTEVTMWLVGAVLADMIIAISLVWHLGRHRHVFPALNSTINRILRMTVQTGVLTTIVAIIDLTCYLTISSGIHLIFNIPLSKLYTNCMLSSLNARKGWTYDGSSSSEPTRGGVHTQSIAFQAQSIQPEVIVDVESHRMTDKPRHSFLKHSGTSKDVWNSEEDGSSINDV
ncbi:hypothetical protein EDC04DRAFT_633830 [Pisolithus marmoratus]|nr:hypothetical protein EDC04DRAFT_633830 [Pisolithus marmoratus]